MAIIPPEERKRRIKWNMEWERKLKNKYFPGIELQGSLSETMAPATVKFLAELSPHVNLQYISRVRELCILQKDLSSFAVQKLAMDDLENKWYGMQQKDRENFILDGIWRAAHVGPDSERQREWCPEITIENLSSLTGQVGFIRLLKMLMPNDLDDELTEPIMVPHPVIDKLLPSSGDTTSFDFTNIRLNRCYFMTMTAWQILLSFYDIEEQYNIAKPPRQSSNPTSVLKEALKHLPKDEAKEQRRFITQHEKNHASIDMVNVCESCREGLATLPEGTQLKACVQCKSIGRTYRYCSRACQVNDWKNGSPFPHKQICGKRLDHIDPGLYRQKLTIDERIPQPEPSFKRSPALLHQISFLKQPPFVDYVFTTAPPHDDRGFSHPMPEARLILLIMRDRALISGDPKAVVAMFRLLAPGARGPGVSEKTLKKQLRDEYGIDVELFKDVGEPAPPTDAEIDHAEAMMMKSQHGF